MKYAIDEEEKEMNIYDFTVINNKGKDVSLAEYRAS